MPFTVALLHARLRIVDLINRELSLHLPHVYKFNILDETLFYEAAQDGLTPPIYRRLVQHFAWAEQMKANVIILTNTILEPAVPVCAKFVSVPVLRINEPMCEEALEEGHRICVLGSMDRAIVALADLLQEIATRRGHTLHVMTKSVSEAVEQLDMGDWDRHNELVLRAVRDLAGKCDAILLAQVSLLPLLPLLKREVDVPVFGSVEPLVARLAKMVRERVPTPPPEKPDETVGLVSTD